MLDRMTATLAALGCLAVLVASVTPVAEVGEQSLTMWGYMRERVVDPTGYPNDSYVTEEHVGWQEADVTGAGRLAWGSRLAIAGAGLGALAVGLWATGVGRVPRLALAVALAVLATGAALLSSGMTAAAGEDAVQWRVGFYAIWAAAALLLTAVVGSARPRARPDPRFDAMPYP